MTVNRLNWDEYFLNIAKDVSLRSTCIKRQYGAIIVTKDKIIVSSGYNGSPRGEVNCCDRGYCKRLNVPHNSGQYDECDSVHAEMNAIISASRSDMIGATLYLYGKENEKTIDAQPCPICMRTIQNAGIKRIVTSKERDEKMTDNEIIKTLECCSTDIRENTCPKCAFYKKHRCSTLMLNAVSSLINRQKSEIERLEHIRKGDEQLINSLNKCYRLAKSEAIKEFAERLKSRLRFYYQNQGMLEKEFCLIHIDETVKEMTEV